MRHDIIEYIVAECIKNNKSVDAYLIEMIEKYFENAIERSNILSM